MGNGVGKGVTASLVLQRDMIFEAKTGSGHPVVLDSSPETGGQNAGPRPMELVLVALGGCTAMDVISILRKMRQATTGYEIRVYGERADTHPMVYERITVEHLVRGSRLAPEQVVRAIELSTRKYCSVLAMLEKTAKVDVRYTIVQEDTGETVNGTIAETNA